VNMKSISRKRKGMFFGASDQARSKASRSHDDVEVNNTGNIEADYSAFHGVRLVRISEREERRIYVF
jgi:hypothetical protein